MNASYTTELLASCKPNLPFSGCVYSRVIASKINSGQVCTVHTRNDRHCFSIFLLKSRIQNCRSLGFKFEQDLTEKMGKQGELFLVSTTVYRV